MKKQVILHVIQQWAANLMLFAVLMCLLQDVRLPAGELQKSVEQAEYGAIEPMEKLFLGAAIPEISFNSSNAMALLSKFAQHLFSFEFDTADGFRVLYMFYAFVLYLFYWTLKHKLHR